MHIEWDEAKDISNRIKHGVSFELAARVFDDPYAISLTERIVDHEARWQTIGRVGDTLVLVAHTWRDDENDEMIRIISARKATPHERRAYEQRRKGNPT